MIININNDVKVNSDAVFAYKLKFGINWDNETKKSKIGRYTKYPSIMDKLLRRPLVHEFKPLSNYYETHESYKNPCKNDNIEEDAEITWDRYGNCYEYVLVEQPRIVVQSAGDNKKTIFFDSDKEALEYYNKIGV